jgi:predicted PurR-regulated permease PerM
MIRWENFENLFRYLIFGGLLWAGFRVIQPFLGALVWAAILAVSLAGVLGRIERGLGGSRKQWAVAMTLLLLIVFVVPLVLLASSLARHVHEISRVAEDLLQMVTRGLPDWLDRIPGSGSQLRENWSSATGDAAAFSAAVRPWIGTAGRWVLAHGGHLVSAFLEALLAVLLSGLLYFHADTVLGAVRRATVKIAGEKGLGLLDVVTRTVRAVTLGIVGIALLHGILMALGLAVAGVPGALPLGCASFFLTLAQLGSGPVWMPVAIWLGYHGHAGWAVALGVWGLSLNTADHFLKPYLISQGAGVPMVVLFLGVVGGLLAWGPIGIFLGATLLAVAYTLFQAWLETA